MEKDRPIVLVEDSKITRNELTKLFKENNFNALVVFSSAEEAMEKIGTMQPLAVVSDFNLGLARMNGLQFLLYMSKNYPDVPTVLISVDDNVADLAAEVNCRFISKFESDKLIDFLQSVI